MRAQLRAIIVGFSSLLTGLRITLGQVFKPTVTVQYPHQSLQMAPRFRGHIELVRDEETGKPLCMVCKACQKACPSDCISVDGIKPEGEKRKFPTEFMLDFTKCSLCAACVEACKTEAIRFSREYNKVGATAKDFHLDLLKRLEEQAQ